MDLKALLNDPPKVHEYGDQLIHWLLPRPVLDFIFLEENKAEGKLKLKKNQAGSAGGTSSQGRERRPRVSWKGANPGLWG